MDRLEKSEFGVIAFENMFEVCLQHISYAPCLTCLLCWDFSVFDMFNVFDMFEIFYDKFDGPLACVWRIWCVWHALFNLISFMCFCSSVPKIKMSIIQMPPNSWNICYTIVIYLMWFALSSYVLCLVCLKPSTSPTISIIITCMDTWQ